jgi:hypothetical protein
VSSSRFDGQLSAFIGYLSTIDSSAVVRGAASPVAIINSSHARRAAYRLDNEDARAHRRGFGPGSAGGGHNRRRPGRRTNESNGSRLPTVKNEGERAHGTLRAMIRLEQMTDAELRSCVVSSNYPWVECSHPGESLPGYIICVHAMVEPIELSIERAVVTKVGTVTCRTCTQSARLYDLRTACAHYVRDHFAVPVE